MKEVIGDFSTKVKMSTKEAKEVCNLGKGDKCCAFLVAGAKGFECIRMSYPQNSSIFVRLEKGTMNAKGEGRWKNCTWEDKIDDFSTHYDRFQVKEDE